MPLANQNVVVSKDKRLRAKPTMDVLLPVPEFLSGFTTCPSLSTELLTIISLDDHCLGVHKITRRTTHEVVEPPKEPRQNIPCLSNTIPSPTVAWEAKYPKGSINPSAPIPGGFGFYLSGPSDFLEFLRCGAQEVLFSYRMMLSDNWDWMKGGKLPDGGVGDQAYGCTGGRKENRCNCFDLRPMWRANAIGELYAYLPLTPNNEAQLAAVPPYSRQNADYGFSVGRGSFCLDAAVGQWIALAFRVKLNDVGSENGEIQFWVNGVSAISVTGLTLRTRADSVIQGMHFQTFFGGHTPDWASPKDQYGWFADISGAIVR
ncbi:polysaccharide lyase family 14 protein [Pleurotus ostreatus PC15]|uniref:Polysaccharide lyase family 14 protein n=1 Tax=Pleurotus ostreatus (strain PC15) TaxID=1137138 RepID=A0A067NWF2_PLEO1|nr:polysaccharide lyase family 14 protein [Pleurotus ostreatus PC15]